MASGVDVVVGVRKDGASWKKAEAAGLTVMTTPEAAKIADIIMILIPDEKQAELYRETLNPICRKAMPWHSLTALTSISVRSSLLPLWTSL